MQYKFTFYYEAEDDDEAEDIMDRMINSYCGGTFNNDAGHCICVRSDWVATGPTVVDEDD